MSCNNCGVNLCRGLTKNSATSENVNIHGRNEPPRLLQKQMRIGFIQNRGSEIFANAFE